MIDRTAIVASAHRIITIANGIANPTRRHDLVAEAAAIIRLCAVPPSMTIGQAEALRRIRDHGPLAWCKGRGRAGGAVSRMFERMAERGWCTRVPHDITPEGREALAQFDQGRYP